MQRGPIRGGKKRTVPPTRVCSEAEKKANPTEWRELNSACRVAWERGLRAEQKRPWLFGILHCGSELARPSCTSHVASQQGSVLVGGEVGGKEGRENEVCLAVSAYKTSMETSLALQLYYRQEPMLLGYPGPVATYARWPGRTILASSFIASSLPGLDNKFYHHPWWAEPKRNLQWNRVPPPFATQLQQRHSTSQSSSLSWKMY